ncbi:type II CRISPR RNA-guided endonuclease Cas9 [Spiroplasma attinicola]|uniref:type II CRISPR RNA-guided endonuclease Cas9 n=1 Tax=Spiroplasma attinicola TaxID=2904537 RepID=UPI002022A657|nr:type II CRISPR RNA-guided endonuclease Cas9 [Spiroplasma sp. JKS002670]MCL8210161.1 CRISPR-associated endonuclease Cas9 [Spiroplasma sp. JKS002670]
MNNKKYYLGLDLGISSVGWAVMTKDEDDYYIDDFGVRLFDCAESPKDGTTNAEERRKFRSVRRLNRRRKQRINELKNFLEKNQIISKSEIADFFSNFKITNNIQYDDTKYFNPYTIRVKALTEKLTPQELAVALINIANHRGYNDKFSFGEEKENKKSKLSESISKGEKIVKNYQTIAQAILNEQDFKNSKNQGTLGLIHNKIKKSSDKQITNENNQEQTKTPVSNYRYLFAREDYKKELELILTTQGKFYPQLANESNRNKIINDIILRQRDFEVGPGPKNKEKYDLWAKKMPSHRLFQPFLETEGKCSFYPNEPRAYRCSLTFELFRFISDLSTFTVKSLDEGTTSNIAKIFFDNLKQGIIPSKNDLKKIIKENTELSETDFTNNPAWKNIKSVNFNYLKLLKELIPNEFKTIDISSLNNHLFNKLGKILHENITPQRRKDNLILFFKENKIDLTEKQIEEKFLGLPSSISTSTGNTSFKYMEEAINAFAKGISYGNFQADFVEKNEEKMFNFKISNKLFQPINDPDLQKNAVVFRAINQTRKIINALHQEYGWFEIINVEVARELMKSFEQRKEIKKSNDLRFDEKLKIQHELDNNNIDPKEINIKKYRLWKQQEQKCIYCQNHHEITLDDFKNSNALQIDHIIPQSKIADDSFNNLVLVCSKANQEKTNQTPLQWLATNKEHKTSYLNFINKVIRKNLSDKKYQYLITKDLDSEMIDEFASRNLNDTRYITRYVANWLNSQFKNWTEITGEVIPTKVQTINGGVTSRFRRTWLNNSPWGLDEKVREITPFHHAVDAMILTQFISVTYVNFATDSANIINLKRSLSKGFINQSQYKNHCDEILKKWTIGKLRDDLGRRLEKLINKEISNFKVMAPLVKNLQEIIETRIPVSLKIKKENKEFKLKNSQDTVFKPIKTPKFVEVLNQESYYDKLKELNLKGNIHYPFISYKIDYKLSGGFTSSQLPVSHDKIKKDINSESYFKDKNNTLWEINSYYGVIFDQQHNFKPIWIRRINATKEELNKYKKQNILVLRTLVEYYDKKTNRKVIKLFNGRMGASVYANLLGTTNIQNLNKNKEIFGNPNYYDSINNWQQEFKIVKPNILGKLVTN